jgi:peptidoglycan L-alanyl-D-glutamate endopeptidase CwlK
MPRFGQESERVLDTVDTRLVLAARKVVRTFDCKALEGFRGAARQEHLYRTKKSHLRWPHSKHNRNPSLALDIAPYPVDWDDRDRFHYFAGVFMQEALNLGIELVWGGDWDGDWQVRDNVFDDLAHFNIKIIGRFP